jgi:preprotein translocase subunit SecE
MARARTSRQKATPPGQSQSVSTRARERQRRVKPVADTKAQTGQKRERRGGFAQFVRECWAELRKVEWPNQRQLVSATVAVIVAVAVVGVFLYAVDEAFSRLVRDVLLNL